MQISNNIEFIELPNGIRIIAEQIPYVQSFSLGFWLNVGTRDELKRQNGISHFIEHMLFKGTKRRTGRKISETIESFGGYLNAFTSKENTCYYSRALSPHFAMTYDVIADMLLNPLFRGQDIRKEAGVILDELKDIEDNPEELIFDKFEEIIFAGHPLSYPIIGVENSITKFDQPILQDFHTRSYGTNNILIAVSGNFDLDRLMRMTESNFHHLRSVRRKGRIQVQPAPAREIEVQREVTQIHCIIGKPSYGYKHDERIALNLLSILLGDGTSSRLYQSVREKAGITYQINSFVNSYYDASAFGIYFSTNENNLSKALKIINTEVRKLQDRRISKKELSRIKEYMKGTILLGMENTSNRMIRLANSILYFDRYIPVEEIITKIDEVTADDILYLAQNVLSDEGLTKIFIRSNSSSRRKGAIIN